MACNPSQGLRGSPTKARPAVPNNPLVLVQELQLSWAQGPDRKHQWSGPWGCLRRACSSARQRCSVYLPKAQHHRKAPLPQPDGPQDTHPPKSPQPNPPPPKQQRPEPPATRAPKLQAPKNRTPSTSPQAAPPGARPQGAAPAALPACPDRGSNVLERSAAAAGMTAGDEGLSRVAAVRIRRRATGVRRRREGRKSAP